MWVQRVLGCSAGASSTERRNRIRPSTCSYNCYCASSSLPSRRTSAARRTGCSWLLARSWKATSRCSRRCGRTSSEPRRPDARSRKALSGRRPRPSRQFPRSRSRQWQPPAAMSHARRKRTPCRRRVARRASGRVQQRRRRHRRLSGQSACGSPGASQQRRSARLPPSRRSRRSLSGCHPVAGCCLGRYPSGSSGQHGCSLKCCSATRQILGSDPSSRATARLEAAAAQDGG